MSLINRDDAIAIVKYSKDPVDKIKNLPAVNAMEVKHGRWERTEDGAAKCTACGRKMNPSQYGYPHCSLCGARMDGE